MDVIIPEEYEQWLDMLDEQMNNEEEQRRKDEWAEALSSSLATYVTSIYLNDENS